jgi:nucleoside-diphosphate-sugar epimerase
MSDTVVILGLGFTMQRLARRLRQRGAQVFAAVRRAERFTEFEALGVRLCGLSPNELPPAAVLVHSAPPLAEPEESAIRSLILGSAPRRVLYISSTGVYGAQTHVSAASMATPNDDKGHARIEEEEWISNGPWSSLILRSAAIYGPGRGVHVRLREGKLPRGTGGVVSRIHVDDLAALLEAGIASRIEGAWPVADDHPAASEEVAAWCAKLMGIPLPDGSGTGFPVAGRHVDGQEIRDLLGVELKHASYKTGIPASLTE